MARPHCDTPSEMRSFRQDWQKKEGLELIRAAALVKNWKCMCGGGYGGLFHSLTDLSCNVFHSEHFHFKTGNCKLPALGVFVFLWCNNIGDHPQEEELAKFGYRSERKVEINFFLRILLFFDEAYLSKYGKFQKLFSLMNFVWVALEFFLCDEMVKICQNKNAAS